MEFGGVGVRWGAFQPEMTGGVGALWPCRTSVPLIMTGISRCLAYWLGMAQSNAPTSESYHHFDGMWLGM